MLALTLPFLIFWLFAVPLEERRSQVAWRQGFVTATVVSGVLTTILIEALNLAGILGATSLVAGWVLA